jgi:hypothetical protein
MTQRKSTLEGGRAQVLIKERSTYKNSRDSLSLVTNSTESFKLNKHMFYKIGSASQIFNSRTLTTDARKSKQIFLLSERKIENFLYFFKILRFD